MGNMCHGSIASFTLPTSGQLLVYALDEYRPGADPGGGGGGGVVTPPALDHQFFFSTNFLTSKKKKSKKIARNILWTPCTLISCLSTLDPRSARAQYTAVVDPPPLQKILDPRLQACLYRELLN